MSMNEKVIELANKIMQGIELDNKSGIGKEKEKPGHIFESTLPENMTVETVKAVNNHVSNFVAASAKAFGELSIEAMAGNKDLNETSIEIKTVDKDHVGHTVRRKAVYENRIRPTEGSDNTFTVYGAMSTEYKTRAGKNTGSLKAVRTHITELAMEKLK